MERAEIVWLGRDNPIARELLAGDAPMDLSAVTRYLLTLGNGGATAAIDSMVTPNVFAAVGAVVQMRLGMQAIALSIQPGRYSAALSVFSATWPNGLLFAAFPVEVRNP